MPQVTKITIPKRSPRKRAVYLDGTWALNCLSVIADKFALTVGLDISDADVEKIKSAEVTQKAFDKALTILSRRLHSVAEIRTKLTRAKYTPDQVDAAVTRLTDLGYLNDERFAKTKAHAAAEYKKHGRRRAYMELVKAGVEKETARRTSESVFEGQDSMKVARELAAKKVPSLRKYGTVVARRRLTGLLVRRGFTFDEIKPVLDEVLADLPETPESDINPRTGELLEDASSEPVDDPTPIDLRANLLAHHLPKREKSPRKPFGRSSFRKPNPS